MGVLSLEMECPPCSRACLCQVLPPAVILSLQPLTLVCPPRPPPSCRASPSPWEGENAVKTGRVMLGETNPRDSKPGTIRGDYSITVGRNIIHGSDAVESANHEIGLWFRDEDLCDWAPAQQDWVYGDN